MRPVIRQWDWRPLSWLPALGWLLLAGDARAQHLPGVPPALGWTDLLNCELVVVGQFKSHQGTTMALEVVEVLRGKTCKAGDVLSVKLSQSYALEFSPRYGDPQRPKAQIPYISFVHEQGANLQKFSLVFDAERPHVYFLPKAAQLLLDRLGQIQPDRRNGWRQALTGKAIDLSFRLLHDLDSEMSRKAVVELFQTRNRPAIADLVNALIEVPNHPRWMETQAFAERALLSLGDRSGDVYEPVLKALRSLPPATHSPAYRHPYQLARILARADSKRALGDLKRMLAPGSRVATDGVVWALHNLETEEGLDLLLELLVNGERHALDSLREMMHIEQSYGVPMVQRAKIQDLAVPRLQKILKSGVLRKELQGWAMANEYFRSLVQVIPENQINKYGKFYRSSNSYRVRKGLPDWDRVVYESGGDLEPLLEADLVEGRKLLRARLAKPDPARPFDLLVSQHLAHVYGDADMKAKAKKPAEPIIRYRDTSSARYHRAPYSAFLKLFKETRKLSDAYWARIAALFPDHGEEYFRELEALIRSDAEGQRYFAIIQQLQSHFFWDFDLDPKDFAPVRDRKLEQLEPLLARLSRGDMLAKRGTLLQHFGVKLEGPPGTAWLPALRAAALSWNPTIKLNALHALGMIEEDSEVLRFANYPLSQRQEAMEAHGKNRTAQWKERQPLTPAQLLLLWRDLDSDKQATGYSAMQALLEAPQSAVGWFRKYLKEPPPGGGPDPKRCRVLLEDLASPVFKVRAQATEALKKMGPGLEPYLRKAMKDAPDVETLRRIQVVLSVFSANDGRARAVRAIQVLEYMPGPEARALLVELAAGPDRLALTHEAQSAMRRLKRFWQW